MSVLGSSLCFKKVLFTKCMPICVYVVLEKKLNNRFSPTRSLKDALGLQHTMIRVDSEAAGRVDVRYPSVLFSL